MSQQENGAPPRPPSNSYPEPHAYPSPQMQPSYTYPPPQGQSSNEPYRQSPTASTMPPTNLNLPPIRGMDGQSQMPAQPPGQQTSPPIPPGQPIPAYSYVSPPGQPMIPGQVGAYTPQRYPLPAQNADARMMSGGRHKKEIKRRTKTGCLTCRKRRIKCDEQHPKCRNCIKSKRECLGYDPIFKQQHNPSQLQPAPTASPSSSTSVPTAVPTPNYPPPTSAAYHHPVTNGNSTSSVTSASVKPDPSQPYEFNSAIDPALAGGDSGTMASTYPIHRSRPAAIGPCKIEDLWYYQGHRPTEIPSNTNPLPPELLDEIQGLYKREFAPGCGNIFETDWYKEHGSDALMASTGMCQAMAELIKHYKYISTGQNFAVENKCRVFETMVVWKLLSLCRIHESSSAIEANGATNSTSPDFKLDELKKRLDVMEALLTNTTLPSNPLAELKYPENLPSNKQQQIDFWRNVGTFVSVQPENPESSRQIEAALGSSRNLLAMNENRDVIYSIMICRHLGRRFPSFPDQLQSRPDGGELDDTNKVVIARDFITNEANWKGTTHPIQRVCDMAIRSWAIRPAETA